MFFRQKLNEQAHGSLGQQALVTGGSRGLGLAVARRLTRRGCDVVIAARDSRGLERALALLEGERVRPEQRLSSLDMDLRSLDAAQGAASALGTLPHLDMILHCAGASLPARAHEESDDDLANTLAVNLTGPIQLTRALLPHLREQQRGHVSFVSSVLGVMGAYGYASYCASKFGILGYALALEQELRPTGVSASVFLPVKLDTEMLRNAIDRMPEETRRLTGTTQPMTAERAADVYLEGIARGKLLIYPDLASRALMATARISPSLVQQIAARSVLGQR